MANLGYGVYRELHLYLEISTAPVSIQAACGLCPSLFWSHLLLFLLWLPRWTRTWSITYYPWDYQWLRYQSPVLLHIQPCGTSLASQLDPSSRGSPTYSTPWQQFKNPHLWEFEAVNPRLTGHLTADWGGIKLPRATGLKSYPFPSSFYFLLRQYLLSRHWSLWILCYMN